MEGTVDRYELLLLLGSGLVKKGLDACQGLGCHVGCFVELSFVGGILDRNRSRDEQERLQAVGIHREHLLAVRQDFVDIVLILGGDHGVCVGVCLQSVVRSGESCGTVRRVDDLRPIAGLRRIRRRSSCTRSE